MMRLDEATPVERHIYITYLLTRGAALTTADIAERTGISRRGAQMLANRLSAKLPIYRDDDGKWVMLIEDDPESVVISLY